MHILSLSVLPKQMIISPALLSISSLLLIVHWASHMLYVMNNKDFFLWTIAYWLSMPLGFPWPHCTSLWFLTHAQYCTFSKFVIVILRWRKCDFWAVSTAWLIFIVALLQRRSKTSWWKPISPSYTVVVHCKYRSWQVFYSCIGS